MSETASAATSSPQADSIATSDRSPSGGNLVARYRLDHSNPVNHFLHVGVGWPMVAISILILPFRPLWSAVLFVVGLCDHVLRPLRVRAEHPDHSRKTEHSLCDRRRGYRRSLGRAGTTGKAAPPPLVCTWGGVVVASGHTTRFGGQSPSNQETHDGSNPTVRASDRSRRSRPQHRARQIHLATVHQERTTTDGRPDQLH